MLVIIGLLVGICAGLLAKGSLSRLLDIRFNRGWLILASFGVTILGRIAGTRFVFLAEYAVVIHGVAFLLLFAGFWFNRHYAGFWVIGLGSFLNGLVMMANGGKMPVSAEAIAKANIATGWMGNDIRHTIVEAGSGTKLPFLADIIHPPGFLDAFAGIVSIGDIVIAVGLGVLVMEIVMGRKLLEGQRK